MRMKCFVFLSVFLFVFTLLMPSFSVLITNSGSGSLSLPPLTFKSWRVGRGVLGYRLSIPEHETFITSTGTECWVEASVGYTSNIPGGGTAPINPDTVSWSFEANHGMELAEPPGTSWSGPHPRKLSGYTSFNVVARLRVPAHTNTIQYPNPNTIPAICTDVRNDDRHDRTPTHRGGTPMQMTITFTAQTTQGDTVTTSSPLNQDETDQIRQEYLDLNRQIPERGTFAPENFYDFGHYDQMIDEDLLGKHDAWVTAINEQYRQNSANLTRDQFVVTSGYRNPHHNVYHSRGLAVHGLHQYGLALDVRGMNIDGIAGNDQQKMADAARLHADPAATTTLLYSTGHVHADWRGSTWPPPNPIPPAPTFSLPAQSNDGIGGTTLTTTAMAACDIHEVSASGSHVSYTCNISPCSNFVWWGCVYAQCPETGNHGKVVCTISGCQDSTPYDPNSSSAGLHAYHSECYRYKCTGGGHSWYPSCTDTTHTNANGDSCTVAGYECVSHTPVYPAGGSTNPESVPELAEESDCPSCGGANFYDCVKCGERFDTCYSHIPNCSVESPSGDFWHSSQQ